jgi:hypothetical protein
MILGGISSKIEPTIVKKLQKIKSLTKYIEVQIFELNVHHERVENSLVGVIPPIKFFLFKFYSFIKNFNYLSNFQTFLNFLRNWCQCQFDTSFKLIF